MEGMEGEGVAVSPWCPRHPAHTCPNSVVLASAATGSRTIVHTNLGLPELTLKDLQAVPLDGLAWVHLEGRNRTNLLAMLDYLANQDSVKVSVEVEKVGRGFEDFIPLADVVFVSKDVAMAHGCRDKEAAIAYFRPRLRAGASLVVAWGEAGAAAWSPGGPVTSPAFPPALGVTDTLGAGDTFNATVVPPTRTLALTQVIGCLATGLDLATSVRTGCQVRPGAR